MKNSNRPQKGFFSLLKDFYNEVNKELVNSGDNIETIKNVKLIYEENMLLLDIDLRIPTPYLNLEKNNTDKGFPQLVLKSIEAQIMRIKYLPNHSNSFQGIH